MVYDILDFILSIFLGGIYKQFVCLLCSVCEWIDGVISLIQITYIIL